MRKLCTDEMGKIKIKKVKKKRFAIQIKRIFFTALFFGFAFQR
jgi:hypothetical protein